MLSDRVVVRRRSSHSPLQSEQLAKPPAKRLNVERFRQEVAYAGFVRSLPQPFVSQPRDHEYRHALIAGQLPEPSRKLQAVHFVHHEIDDDSVRTVGGTPPQRVGRMCERKSSRTVDLTDVISQDGERNALIV